VFSVEQRVGRLLEIRVGGTWTLEEVVQFGERYKQVVGPSPDQLFMACSDLRGARLFPPDAADLMAAFMRTRKTRIDHNAILISPSPIIGLQVDRLIRTATHPGRHILRTVDEALAFLEPHLTVAERHRQREFLEGR
jgi:hypothetical protein